MGKAKSQIIARPYISGATRPELSGVWTVEISDYVDGARVNLEKRVLQIPSVERLAAELLREGVDPNGFDLQAVQSDLIDHELAHVAISPVEVTPAKGVHPIALQLAEDTRVGLLNLLRGKNPKALFAFHKALNARMASDAFKLGDDHPHVRFAKARICVDALFSGLPAYESLHSNLARLIDYTVNFTSESDQVYRVGRTVEWCRKSKMYRETESLAREITERFFMGMKGEANEPKESDAVGKEVKPGGTSAADIARARADGAAIERMMGEAFKQGFMLRTDNGTWRKPILICAPLTVPVVDPHGKGPRSQREGMILRYPSRLFTNQKVFARVNHSRVGNHAFLIDASGSMAWAIDQLVCAITAISPHGTVAIYNTRNAQAKITVLAHNGRRFTPETFDAEIGGGNECDGPAIEWVARLRKVRKRFWISDGYATYRGDATGDAAAVARKLAKRLGVQWIDTRGLADLSNLIELLTEHLS